MLSPLVAANPGTKDEYSWYPLQKADSENRGVASRRGNSLQTPAVPRASVMMSSEYYSSDSLSMTYTNADGDSVSLALEHVEYQKAMIAADGDADSAQWTKIVEYRSEEQHV